MAPEERTMVRGGRVGQWWLWKWWRLAVSFADPRFEFVDEDGQWAEVYPTSFLWFNWTRELP